MTAQVIPVEAILGKPDFKYQKVQYRRHVWQPGFGPPEEEAPPALQAQYGTSSSSSMYIRSKDYGFQRNVWTPGDVQYRDSELGSGWQAPEGYEGVYDASVWGIPTDGDMLPVIDIDWDELNRRKLERDARLAAEEEAARRAAEAALAAAHAPEVPGPPMSRLDYDRMLGLGGQKELGGPLGGEYVTPTEEDRPVDMQAQARPGGGAMPDGTDTVAGDSAARKGHELNRRKLGIVTRPSTMHDRTYGKTAEGGKGAELYQRRQRRVVQFSKEDIRSFKPWLSLIYVPPTEILPYYGKPFKEEPGPPAEPAPLPQPKKPGQKVIPRAPMSPWTAAMTTGTGDVEPAFSHLRKRGAPFATYLEKGMMGDQPETVGAVQAVMGAAEGKRSGAAGGGRGGAGGGGAFAGEGSGVRDGAYGSGFHLEKVNPDGRGEFPNYKDFNRTAKGWLAMEGAETYAMSEAEAASRGFFSVRHIDVEADVWRPDPDVVKAILQERAELHLPPELVGLPESEEL